MKSFLSSITLLTLSTVLIFTHSLLTAQNTDIRYMHNETPDDEYLPMLPKEKKTSPAYRSRSSNFFTIQVNIDENGDNILLDAANEPSIAIDPTNPDRIVIGWRQFDNVMSNFRQAGFSYSTDGGQSWTSPEPIDAGIFRSDPVLGADADGNIYYNSLTKDASNNYWCDVYISDNGGAQWDDGTYAYGGDKQWMVIDRTGGIGDGNIYEFWNSSFSSCYPGSYTRSTDGNNSYDDCDGVPGDPIWGTLAVGPEGELYLVGAPSAPGLVVTKSYSAQNPASQTIWEVQTYVDMEGNLSGWRPVNPSGLLGQAYIDVDVSDGAGRGNVYVLASVFRDNDDPGDVMFARSIDGGQTWDPAIKVNDDFSPSVVQWFGTMSVAPNGRIDAVWLDTRNAPGINMFISELYYSYSIDQGVTWSVNEKLSEAFDPHVGWPNQNKMGDYFHMISDDNGAHLAWANTINGEQDVYYGYINPWFVGVEDKVENDFSFINYPNPVRNNTTLRYELQKSNNVNISVYNIFGNKVDVVTDKIQQPGIHNIVFDASQLANGIYFCTLTIGSKTETIKLTIVD
ncbi:MAG: T9SS type A sorting domain-containing protein [Bacteroidota bacterium]